MAIKISTGFSIGSKDLIDDRLVLSKAQMLALNENTYPEQFFCLCSDDNKIYVYNSSNTPNDITGKFVVYVGTDGTTGVSIDDIQASSTTTYSSNKIEANYQKINDDILTTNNKTIVGSINELNEEIGNKGIKPIPESYVKVYRNILEQPNGKIANGNKCQSTIGQGMMYLPKTNYVLYHIKNNDVIENSLQDGHTYTLTYNSNSNATVEYFIFDYAVDSMDIKCIAKKTVTSGTKITMPTNSYWFQMNTLKSDNITNISLVDDTFPYDNIRLVVADGNVSDANTQIAVSTIGDIASVGEYIKLIPETIGIDSTGIYKYIDDKANATDLTTHTDDTDIHVTSAERTKWNKVIDKLDTVDFNTHKDNTDIHITSAERTKWNKVDEKANASDIPTKTSELTNDSNYVTEETVNAELNKKINKTDITTTINSTSTDTQVPSAKTAYDNSLTKGISLGNTRIPEGADLNNYLTPGVYTCWSGDEAKTLLNCPHTASNFKMIVNQNRGNKTVFYGYQMIVGTSTSIYNPSIYYRGISWSTTTNNTFSPWKRVCTTSVADVPITYINTFEDETYVKPANNNTNGCSYHVTNGICVIKLETVCLSTTDNFVRILSGLPKPTRVLYSNTIDRVMSSNSGARGVFKLVTDGTLQIVCSYGDPSVTKARNFYTSFSYPVEES